MKKIIKLDKAKEPFKQSSRRPDHTLEEMTNRIDHVLLTNHLSDLVEEYERIENIQNKGSNLSKTFIRYTTEPPESIKFEAMKSSSYRQKLIYRRLANTLDGGDQRLNISPHINLDIVWYFLNELDYQSTSRIVRNIKLGVKGYILIIF
jgi:hypothetical protein